MMQQFYYYPNLTLAQAEKNVILSALKYWQNNKTATAQSLGITAKTLASKLKSYGIDDETEQQRKNRKLNGDQDQSNPSDPA